MSHMDEAQNKYVVNAPFILYPIHPNQSVAYVSLRIKEQIAIGVDCRS